jgi:hypothetical protein
MDTTTNINQEAHMINTRRTGKMQNARHFFLKNPAAAMANLIELRVPAAFALTAFGPSLCVATDAKPLVWDAYAQTEQSINDEESARAQYAARHGKFSPYYSGQ